MFETLKMKLWQKKQYIPDIKNAPMREQFRGLPKLTNSVCNSCEQCIKACPTGAISINPLKIDMAKCTLCGACKNFCQGAIDFTNFYKLGTDKSEKLIVTEEITPEKYYERAIEVRKEIYSIFNRSIKFRQVSAGGCNGCEMELNAAGNANFDMGRYGIDFVASPRHADGIVITGPITKNMAYALEDCYKSTPDPKVVILCGTCAISGGVFKDSTELNREFLDKYKVDLYIPGCPVHPLTFINAILDFIRKK
ncbi:MAG: 4Fe-4S binding protein [Candidatus Gastranaerophilales bacterium]|nr:4Fe-4S binding protein [Candidatus Gastranaerophilales bacterium]